MNKGNKQFHAPESYINCRTLIIGEVNSGKTSLTQTIMQSLIQAGHGREILLLDLAPMTTQGIGGKMRPRSKEILRLTAIIRPPRLTGNDAHHIQQLADQNARAIEPLIDRACASQRDILIVNDASLYLQAGAFARFQSLVDAFATAVINAYYGKSFKPAPFTDTERQNVKRLIEICDRTIPL